MPRRVLEAELVNVGDREPPASLWCVLEAELVHVAAAVLRVDGREALAPSAGLEASEGWVHLVPFDDTLPEVVGSHLPHLCRSVRLEQVEQLLV